MALVNVEPQAEVTMTCRCGHSWKSGVTVESRALSTGEYSWERGEIKVGVKVKAVDVYCSRCASSFDRVSGVIDGEDELDEPKVVAAPVAPETYAVPEPEPEAEAPTSARFEVEEISAAI